MNTATRDERRSALDDFAAKTVPQATDMVAVAAGPPADAVYGSREVAARRDNRMVLVEIRELATAAGTDWYYRFPVKNKKAGTTDWIEGPTIELALDVARAYGNCHVDCRAQDLGNVILFHARFHDVEKGFSMTRPFQQRKGASRLGGADEGRRDEIDFQIGASKAIRNVILNALRTYANFGFEEAKEALVDKIGSQIERYRATTVERIGKLVTLDRVEAVIGRKAAEWLAPDIARVIAMGKAINDGMATVDETFPPLGGHAEPASDAGNKALDDFANSDPGGRTTGQAAASVSQDPPPDEAAATDAKPEIIFKMLQLAQDPDQNAASREESLGYLKNMLENQYPELGDFIDNAIKIAVKVARKELPVEKAQTFIEGLSK